MGDLSQASGEQGLITEGKADWRCQPRARRRLLAIGGVGCRLKPLFAVYWLWSVGLATALGKPRCSLH